VKDAVFEVAPAEVSVMELEPASTVRSAVIVAVTWFELTTVVATAVPLKSTTESNPNPAPFTVTMRSGPPAVVVAGLMLVILGAIVPEYSCCAVIGRMGVLSVACSV